MLEKVGLSKISPKYAKIKKASPEALSRTHYIRCLRQEEKFLNSTEKMESYIGEWSLKAIPQFFKSLAHFTKMAKEKAKSAYYFRKL